MLIKMSHSEELHDLEHEFRKFDTDHTGMINEDELHAIFKSRGI